jgi:hypothetical protein
VTIGYYPRYDIVVKRSTDSGASWPSKPTALVALNRNSSVTNWVGYPVPLLDAAGAKPGALPTVLVREQQIGGSGGSLEPPGPLLEPPGPLLTHPLAERTCFSQVLVVFCNTNRDVMVVRSANLGSTSPGRYILSNTTRYMPLVVLHTKYTGVRENDFDVYA